MWLRLLEKVKGLKVGKYLMYLIVPIILILMKPIVTWVYNKVRNKTLSAGTNISTEQAEQIVERISDCFNNTFDNSDCIYELLGGISKADYFKVKDAFGTEYRSPYTGEITWWWFPGASSLNLTQWLAHELENDQLKKLKQINPNLPI